MLQIFCIGINSIAYTTTMHFRKSAFAWTTEILLQVLCKGFPSFGISIWTYGKLRHERVIKLQQRATLKKLVSTLIDE